MEDSIEFKTMKRCTKWMETALKGLDRNMVDFLYQNGFITEDDYEEVLNPVTIMRPIDKACNLVKGIKNRVKQDKRSYFVLVGGLIQGGALYQPIVNILSEEYQRQQQTGDIPNQNEVFSSSPNSLQSSTPSSVQFSTPSSVQSSTPSSVQFSTPSSVQSSIPSAHQSPLNSEVPGRCGFQYLKNDGLTEDQREKLLTKLSDDFDIVIFKFSSLVYQTLQLLKDSSKNPGDLRALIKTYLPGNTEILEHFVAAKTFDDLFDHNYWSFFDYELLALVINNCCDELNWMLTDYVTTFKAYCCRRVSEVPTPFTSVRGKHYTIRVKLAKEFDSLTMNEVKDVEARLIKIIKTDLHLLKFESGCIVIVFTSLSKDDMLPLTEVQKCELFQLSVLKLYSDNHVYFDRDKYIQEIILQSQDTRLEIISTIMNNSLCNEDMTSVTTVHTPYQECDISSALSIDEPSHEDMTTSATPPGNHLFTTPNANVYLYGKSHLGIRCEHHSRCWDELTSSTSPNLDMYIQNGEYEENEMKLSDQPTEIEIIPFTGTVDAKSQPPDKTLETQSLTDEEEMEDDYTPLIYPEAGGAEERQPLLPQSTTGSIEYTAQYGSNLVINVHSLEQASATPRRAANVSCTDTSQHNTGYGVPEKGVNNIPVDRGCRKHANRVSVQDEEEMEDDYTPLIYPEAGYGVPEKGANNIPVDRGCRKHANRVSVQGHRSFKIFCAFLLISLLLLLFGLFPSGALGIVAIITKCHSYEVSSMIYSEDSILVAELTDCQWNTSLWRSKHCTNSVNVYAPPCDAVKVHSEKKNFSSLMYSNMTFGKEIVDVNLGNISNYFVENSTVAITAEVSSTDSTEAFMCIYTNSTIFSDFLYPSGEDYLLDVMKFAIRCDKIELRPNDSIKHKMAFQVNVTGYYFVGISPSYNTPFSVQFNLAVLSNYYNRSDFLQYRISCPLSTENSNCPVKNSYTSTCIMLYASQSFNNHDFNYFHITIMAEGYPVVLRPVFKYTAIGSITMSLFLVPIVLSLIYYCHKQIKHSKN